MATSIETDPVYRTARLLSYRDQQCEDLCTVLEGSVVLADEVARSGEAALADLIAGSDAFETVKTQCIALRRIAAHFAREAENTRRSWAIKQQEERS